MAPRYSEHKGNALAALKRATDGIGKRHATIVANVNAHLDKQAADRLPPADEPTDKGK